MTPIDSAIPACPDPKPPMAPPYVDENPNLELVEEGLAEADNETREAVADGYEADARLSNEPEEVLNDIDFATAEDESSDPEVDAIHEEFIPVDDEGEEE
ncbi:MAG: hypothetical protein V4689_22540 [Verrucomicrobiota bacterium]